jgi:anti-sigma B factor antagonist
LNSAPVGIQLSTRRAAEATVICVRGELDVLSAPQLAAQLDEVVRAGGDGVIVDLRQTSFIDSTALHVLINSQRRLTRQSRKLTVIADPGPVRRVFELARLIETLGVVSGADD